MKIRSLTARPILDSRGAWTIETAIELWNGARAKASAPQGKSTGKAEAPAIPAAAAIANTNDLLSSHAARVDFRDQASFDALLCEINGGSARAKVRLGSSATLAASVAFLRATAQSRGVPLWREVGAAYGEPLPSWADAAKPWLFANLVNGGLHAGNNLDFQEYLAIAKGRTFRESTEIIADLYRELGNALVRAKGKNARNVGDEGGYAPDFSSAEEPFRIMARLAKKLKLGNKVMFGMDAAATDVPRGARSRLGERYASFIRRYGLAYLEDPFGEEEFGKFAALTEKFGGEIWIAGDDLTTTNTNRMARALKEGSVNAVIVKPNQIGTVTLALDAVRAARRYGWAVIASHRSGETDDDFIADFAYGVRADGLKLGAPARGERIAKYNRLLEIEAEAAAA